MTESIDIILPAYHEQDNLPKVLSGIKKYVKTKNHIYLVLQDKNDPTLKVAKRFKNVKIVFTDDGVGLAKAIKKGLQVSKSPTIIIMMSDGSDDPKSIDIMVEKINDGYDLVCSSRYIPGGKKQNYNPIKHFLSLMGCMLINKIAGVPTHDATNAFKAFRRTLIKEIAPLESQNGYELPLEIVVKAFKNRCKITEIPTHWQERVNGKSKFKIFKQIPNYLRWVFYLAYE